MPVSSGWPLKPGAIRYFVVSGPGSAPVLPYLLSNKTDTKQLRRVDLPYTNDDNDERGDESVLSTSSGDEAENSEADGNDAFLEINLSVEFIFSEFGSSRYDYPFGR